MCASSEFLLCHLRCRLLANVILRKVSIQNSEPVQVAVLGLGYVGCVTAACLADLGHHVTGVDRDEHKVRSIVEAKAPFYEPGLEEIVARNVHAGRLAASTCTEEVLQNADIGLICVGTPSARNGNLGIEQLRRVIEEISSCLRKHPHPMVVAVRSTIFPGTCEEVVAPELAGLTGVAIVSNPEFLREGTAVRDFVEPSLVVVGGADSEAVRRVADLYAPLHIQPCLVSLRTAEMIKYACNAFHAVKISFANEIGALCSRLDVAAQEVMETLCRDVKLNVSSAYLKPGFAFGGSCLPKDLRALTYRASRLDLHLPLLESALPSNDRHLQRGTQAVLDLSSPGAISLNLSRTDNFGPDLVALTGTGTTALDLSLTAATGTTFATPELAGSIPTISRRPLRRALSPPIPKMLSDVAPRCCPAMLPAMLPHDDHDDPIRLTGTVTQSSIL